MAFIFAAAVGLGVWACAGAVSESVPKQNVVMRSCRFVFIVKSDSSGPLRSWRFYSFNEQPEAKADFVKTHRHHVAHADHAQAGEDDDGERAEGEKQRREDSQDRKCFRHIL